MILNNLFLFSGVIQKYLSPMSLAKRAYPVIILIELFVQLFGENL
jgi:hypothetical protein